MAATKYEAVHLIPVVRKDEKSGLVRRKNIEPGTVVSDFTDDEVKRLIKLGAIKKYDPKAGQAKETSSKSVDDDDNNGTGEGERTREELLARAKELELSVPSNIGDAKLKEKVEAAEAELDDGL